MAISKREQKRRAAIRDRWEVFKAMGPAPAEGVDPGLLIADMETYLKWINTGVGLKPVLRVVASKNDS